MCIWIKTRKIGESEYRKSRCFRYSWALKPREALIAADELEWWREGKARAPLLVLGGTCVLWCFVSSFCVRRKHLYTFKNDNLQVPRHQEDICHRAEDWVDQGMGRNQPPHLGESSCLLLQVRSSHLTFTVPSSLFTTCHYYFIFGIVVY